MRCGCWCSAKSFPKKFARKYLCYTIKEFQAVKPATLLKIHPSSGISEPDVCRSSTKQLFLNNSQNSQEKTYVGVTLFKNTLFYRRSPVAAPERFRFPACNFIIKQAKLKMFFCVFCKIFKDIFSFERIPQDDCFLCLSVKFF